MVGCFSGRVVVGVMEKKRKEKKTTWLWLTLLFEDQNAKRKKVEDQMSVTTLLLTVVHARQETRDK